MSPLGFRATLAAPAPPIENPSTLECECTAASFLDSRYSIAMQRLLRQRKKALASLPRGLIAKSFDEPLLWHPGHAQHTVIAAQQIRFLSAMAPAPAERGLRRRSGRDQAENCRVFVTFPTYL